MRVWHDEMARWEKTGRLDQGPCWCVDCVNAELKKLETNDGGHRNEDPDQ